MGSVLVEIPIATTRDSPWDKVWGQLDKASAHFNAGGETGWEGCVVSVRKALELQAGIEERSLDAQKLDKGQGQRERLNGVARALYHYCSLSVHTDKHETAWTRADATLALSTLCALLSASAV